MAIPYHATAVKTGNHLIRCLADIDLNIDKETPTELFWGGLGKKSNVW